PNLVPRLSATHLSLHSLLNLNPKLSGRVLGWCALRSTKFTMHPAITVITTLLGMFAFAFGLAWFVPLASAHSDNRKSRPAGDIAFPLLDILLLLLDCIPIFWLFRSVPFSSEARHDVKDQWRKDKSIRVCFYLFLACCTLILLLTMLNKLIN
ncbi:hypothetical protein, partial [Rubritalea sp.]|uniref:hypothetical protein n=1 Tax=Rubritalea sp. TaxID=2109375 RepID=UPI003EF7D4BB